MWSAAVGGLCACAGSPWLTTHTMGLLWPSGRALALGPTLDGVVFSGLAATVPAQGPHGRAAHGLRSPAAVVAPVPGQNAEPRPHQRVMAGRARARAACRLAEVCLAELYARAAVTRAPGPRLRRAEPHQGLPAALAGAVPGEATLLEPSSVAEGPRPAPPWGRAPGQPWLACLGRLRPRRATVPVSPLTRAARGCRATGRCAGTRSWNALPCSGSTR